MFFKIFEIYEKFWKTHISLLLMHIQLSPSIWAKLGYSHIKIDHIADSLLKLQIKIGVHLISVELSQLLNLLLTNRLTLIFKHQCVYFFHLSTFGEFNTLYLWFQKGDPMGGHINNYLLEKSRVVHQQAGTIIFIHSTNYSKEPLNRC